MATIYAVSKLAGVSLATVSRVINGNQKVSEKTRKKVQDAIDTLGYRPNTAAKTLAANRSDSIGLLVSELHGPFYGRMMSEIEKTLREAGKHVIITAGHSEAESEKDGIEFLINRNCDALILHVEAMEDADLVSLTRGDTPVCLLNRKVDIIADNCIYLDNFHGGEIAGNCILDHGHTKIACITGPIWKTDAKDRYDGLVSSLANRRLGLDARLVTQGDFREPSGYSAMQDILSSGLAFTAVVCGNDEMAIGAMRAIREHGLVVGKDISVIGFDNIEFARFTNPALTTIRYPIGEMGRMAANLLLSQKYGIHGDRIHHQFKPELQLRESVQQI